MGTSNVVRTLGALLLLGSCAAMRPLQAQDSSREQLTTLLTEARAEVRRFRAAIDRSHFDLDALANRLGSTAAIVSFVRTEIAYEPYAGALRGAEGCLRSRAGNSWDQALLLSELLRRRGLETRLARAALDEEAATRLVDTFLGAVRSPAPLDLPYFVDGPVLEDERQRATEALEGLLARRFERLIGTFSGLLRADEVQVNEPRVRARLVEAARDHAWVQVLDGGRVHDVDPSGDVRAQPIDLMADVPPELWHRVVVRVRIEVFADGAVSERVVLESRHRACELSSLPVILDVSRNKDAAAAVGGALQGQRERLLRLHVGDRVVADGVLPLDSGGGSGGGFGALADAFGGGGGGGGSRLVSVSVTLSTEGPGEPAGEERLHLIDRWGTSARAARDLSRLRSLDPRDETWLARLDGTSLSVGVATGASCPPFLQDQLLALTDAKLEALVVDNDRVHFRAGTVSAWDAYFLSGAYVHVLDGMADRSADGESLTDSVRLSAVLLRHGSKTSETRFDITRDCPTQIPSSSPSARRIRLERDLLAAIVEEELTLDPLDVTAGPRGQGAARVLEASLESGPPRIIRSAEAIPADVTPNARAAITRALREALVVVLPSTAPTGECSWFELSPDGPLRALSESGLHQGLTEYSGNSSKSGAASATAASRVGNAVRGTFRCIVHNVNTLVFLAIDAGTAGLTLGAAGDAAQGVATCLGLMRGKPIKGRPFPPRRHRTTPYGERHIRDRHVGSHPQFPDKSKWRDISEWRRRQRETLKKPDRIWRQPDGRWRYERRFDQPVGTGPSGEPCHWVRTVVEPNGDVVTSFPASGPWTP